MKDFDIDVENKGWVKRDYKNIEVNQISANLAKVLKTFV